jgi:hypothetical protein
MRTKSIKISIRPMAWVFAIVLVLAGCKDLSNDPPEQYGNLVVNIQDIQSQLGIDTTGRQLSVSVPQATEATDAVASLLVGAFVVTSRDTPYTADVAITSEVEENLNKELSGSVDYIQMVSLPTDKDYIEFPYPKSELSNWQVIAVGLNFPIQNFAQLGEEAHEDAIVYAGFSDRFYKASTIGANEVVELRMSRACLTNPVKGCATYSDHLSKDPVVTPAVEILGVRYNNQTSDFTGSSVSFPIIVRTEAEANTAVQSLKTVVTAIGNTPGVDIENLTVRATHTLNTAESDACRAYGENSAVTVAQLEDACSVTSSKITLVE